MLSTLHHLTLVVRDLSLAKSRYAALFGRGPNWHGESDGAQHVWFQFDNTALDIVAPLPKIGGSLGDAARRRLDNAGEGIWAMAFGTRDLQKARHVLARRGIASHDPHVVKTVHIESVQARSWGSIVLSREYTHGVAILVAEQNPIEEPWPTANRNASDEHDDSSLVTGLDHVVVSTSHPERAAALYGARLGLEMKLDRTNPDWGTRLMFFKCNDLIVEIAHRLKGADPTALDTLWGLSWRVANVETAHARMAQSGHSVSDIRAGRKPGTRVFTVRDAAAKVPTLVIGKAI